MKNGCLHDDSIAKGTGIAQDAYDEITKCIRWRIYMLINTYLAIPLWIFGIFGFINFLLRLFDHLGSTVKRRKSAYTLVISAKNQEECIEGIVRGFILKADLNESERELLQIVLVDLGSSDKTPKIMELLTDKYPCIRFLKPSALASYLKGLL